MQSEEGGGGPGGQASSLARPDTQDSLALQGRARGDPSSLWLWPGPPCVTQRLHGLGTSPPPASPQVANIAPAHTPVVPHWTASSHRPGPRARLGPVRRSGERTSVEGDGARVRVGICKPGFSFVAELVGNPPFRSSSDHSRHTAGAPRSVPCRTVSHPWACQASPHGVPASHTGGARGWGTREDARVLQEPRETGVHAYNGGQLWGLASLWQEYLQLF